MFKTAIGLCILGLLLTAQVWGQIVIPTNDFMPAPGTEISYSYDPAMDSIFYSSLTAGSGGPMLWDLTSRVFDPAYSELSVNLASTPSIDSFPGANLSILMLAGPDSVWTLSNSQSDVFRSVGMVHHSVLGSSVVVYKDAAPEFVFPIALGNQWTSFRHWTQSAGLYHNNIYDTTKLTVDAWGTVKYGSKSVPCLRILALETSYIKLFDYFNNLIDSSKTDIYAVYFVAAGFDLLVSACKSVSSDYTSYSLTASTDFVKSPTDVAVGSGTLPSDFVLGQNFPNPFNPTTTIQYTLPARSAVKIEVYNISGQLVRVLGDGERPAGIHTITWDGRSGSGEQVSTGVYLYRLQAGSFAETRKMLLLK